MSDRLFEQAVDNVPDTTFKIAFGQAGQPTFNMALSNFIVWLAANLSIPIPPEEPITEQTIVNIGDWNMNSSAAGDLSVSVAHGVADYTKIRRITAMILPDVAATMLPLDSVVGVSATPNGGVSAVDATNITLLAATGGNFDDTAHDATSFNRGYIIIDSIP